MTVKPTEAYAAPAHLIGGVRADVAAALSCAARIAADRSFGLWLIGGAARDLLRGAELDRDLDLAVEGDAVELASALAGALGGNMSASHRDFGTATITLPSAAASSGQLSVDLAGTRAEDYPQPAALPLVRAAAIDDDLRRRDFTVNAIAIELRADAAGLHTGALLDPFGGRADLAAGRLRLLHADSLRDDPTRLLRGLRLACRLSLQPDEGTAALIVEALERHDLALLTPERILGELCLALDEPRPGAVLALADAWGVTPQIAPGLAWSESLEARVTRWQTADTLPQIPPPAAHRLPPALIVAGLLCYDLSAEDLAMTAKRYPLPAPFARLLKEIPTARAAVRRASADARPSQIDLMLRPFSEATISVLHYAERDPAAQIAARYLREIRPARAPLDGRDLQRLGVAAGPLIGRLLDGLRAAHLDGEVTTHEQAERWVHDQID